MASSSSIRKPDAGPKYVKQAVDKRLVGKYKIAHPDDTESFLLRSCIYLPDHGYVMIDRANKNIKLVDESFKVMTVIKLGTSPFDLCASNKNKAEFYVSEPGIQHVHCIAVEKGKLRIKKSMAIEEDCRGITCWKSGVAVAVTREGFKGVLGLLDYNCTIAKIKKKVWETEVHTELFKAPWYLTSIKDGTEIVVSDQGNHSVICLDAKTMTTVFIFKDSVLIGPRSICADSHDNVYVIGSSESCHSVVKLSSEGKLQGVPLSRKDKLNFPSGICYNAKDDTVVLQPNRESPAVAMYRL